MHICLFILGTDYVDPDGIYILNATTSRYCVTFDPIDDNTVESQEELVHLHLSTDFPSGVIIDIDQVNITIEDNDSKLLL